MDEENPQAGAMARAAPVIIGVVGLGAGIASIIIGYWAGAVGGLFLAAWMLYMLLVGKSRPLKTARNLVAAAPTPMVILLAIVVAGVAALLSTLTMAFWTSLILAAVPLLGFIIWAIFYRETRDQYE